MTTRADYTEEEWAEIMMGPFLAGLLIMLTNYGGVWHELGADEHHSLWHIVGAVRRAGPLRVLRELRAGVETGTGGHMGLIALLRGQFAQAFEGTQPLPGDYNALINGVRAELQASTQPGGLSEETKPADPAAGSASEWSLDDAPAQLRATLLGECGKLAAILAAKAPPPAAKAYKRWLLDIARHMAETGKEGGVLGLGGTRVNAAEAAMLADLAAALELRE
jgi:hypothetical protein